MREIDFEEVFQTIKVTVMEDEGYDEEDMENEEIENKVNSIAKDIFKARWGFDYDDLED
jgi:hypothetical protein